MKLKHFLLISLCVTVLFTPAMAEVIFHDDFDNDLSNWKIITGKAEVVNSTVTLGHPLRNTKMVTKQDFDQNTSLYAYGKLSRVGLAGSIGYFTSYGFYSYAAFFAGNGQYRAGAMDSPRRSTLIAFNVSDGDHLWGIERSPTSINYTVDNTTVATIATNIPTRNMSLEASALNLARSTTLDWIEVRSSMI